MTFDDSKVTIWDAETGVYAQADQPGSVDDATVYFVRDLQMRLPLAPLLTTRFPAELERGRPQYWAQFSDWNLRPQVSDKTFAFEAPQGARQIAFQVQISTLAGAAPPGDAMVEEGEP